MCAYFFIGAALRRACQRGTIAAKIHTLASKDRYAMAFRYAFCNEAFEDWEFERICDYLAEHGYQGIEAAPFTFEKSVFDITPQSSGRAPGRQQRTPA